MGCESVLKVCQCPICTWNRSATFHWYFGSWPQNDFKPWTWSCLFCNDKWCGKIILSPPNFDLLKSLRSGPRSDHVIGTALGYLVMHTSESWGDGAAGACWSLYGTTTNIWASITGCQVHFNHIYRVLPAWALPLYGDSIDYMLYVCVCLFVWNTWKGTSILTWCWISTLKDLDMRAHRLSLCLGW